MLDALCEYLLEKPDLFRDEVVLFVLDEFNTHVTPERKPESMNYACTSLADQHFVPSLCGELFSLSYRGISAISLCWELH